MKFRRLPITSAQDTTQNFEQLQAQLTATIKKAEAVATPAENVKALTEAVVALRKVLEELDQTV